MHEFSFIRVILLVFQDVHSWFTVIFQTILQIGNFEFRILVSNVYDIKFAYTNFVMFLREIIGNNYSSSDISEAF